MTFRAAMSFKMPFPFKPAFAVPMSFKALASSALVASLSFSRCRRWLARAGRQQGRGRGPDHRRHHRQRDCQRRGQEEKEEVSSKGSSKSKSTKAKAPSISAEQKAAKHRGAGGAEPVRLAGRHGGWRDRPEKSGGDQGIPGVPGLPSTGELTEHERTVLVTAYHRAKAGGSAISEIVSGSVYGLRGRADRPGRRDEGGAGGHHGGGAEGRGLAAAGQRGGGRGGGDPGAVAEAGRRPDGDGACGPDCGLAQARGRACARAADHGGGRDHAAGGARARVAETGGRDARTRGPAAPEPEAPKLVVEAPEPEVPPRPSRRWADTPDPHRPRPADLPGCERRQGHAAGGLQRGIDGDGGQWRPGHRGDADRRGPGADRAVLPGPRRGGGAKRDADESIAGFTPEQISAQCAGLAPLLSDQVAARCR